MVRCLDDDERNNKKGVSFLARTELVIPVRDGGQQAGRGGW